MSQPTKQTGASASTKRTASQAFSQSPTATGSQDSSGSSVIYIRGPHNPNLGPTEQAHRDSPPSTQQWARWTHADRKDYVDEVAHEAVRKADLQPRERGHPNRRLVFERHMPLRNQVLTREILACNVRTWDTASATSSEDTDSSSPSPRRCN